MNRIATISLSLMLGVLITLGTHFMVTYEHSVHIESANERCRNAGGEICPMDASTNNIYTRHGWPLATANISSAEETGSLSLSPIGILGDSALYAIISYALIQVLKKRTRIRPASNSDRKG